MRLRSKSYIFKDGKMDAIQTQVSRYITGDALNNSLLGVVEFSYSFKTKVTVPLTKLDTRATRESIAAKLPVTSAGSTCIQCGVQKALTVYTLYNIRNTSVRSVGSGRAPLPVKHTDAHKQTRVKRSTLKMVHIIFKN